MRSREIADRFAGIPLWGAGYSVAASIALLPLALHGLWCAPLLAADKPNIVYIMADELGYYELGCTGNPNIQTPRIDQMAREGIRFTQALAGSSLCAPTRACLMTGKHSGHTSVRTNGGGTPLRADEQTVASFLKLSGYATGGFGKWGCGGRGSDGVPEKHGFDIFFGYYDQVHAHTYYPPYLVRNSEEVPLAGNRGGRSGATYSHYVIVDAAKKFILANKDKPFFCYLPITPPHGMFDIPDADPAWQVYADKPWPEDARRYAAMVTMVDRQVGQLFELLRELDLDEKTIVFFCGDNGGADYFRDPQHPRGFHGANVNPETGVQFRGKKGNLYEGGLRVPMIVRWPGKIAPRRVSDLLCYFPDILPTLTELAGLDTPQEIDGISIVPELLGQEAAGRPQTQHEYLYWELGRQTAVRMESWKAVRPRTDRPWELYDLRDDLSESYDVATQHPEILAKMKAFATAAHEPAIEGVFHDRGVHEKDRRAKGGGAVAPQSRRQVSKLQRQALIPHTRYAIARVSSESKANGKLARNAIDGDPRTHWHTRFGNDMAKPPHELVIDLGGEHTIRGFRYLARQDAGWNGTVGQCELYVSRDGEEFGQRVGRAKFQKTKQTQQVDCPPQKGRYVLLRILSEIQGGPWASAAEVGVIGD